MTSPVTIPQAIDIALRHHNAGELQQAEVIYRQILDIQPDHPDVLHLLGLIAHQVGRNDAAIELIGKALSLFSGNPLFHGNLGSAQLESGRLEEAVASFRAALNLKADYPESHFNLGIALSNLGRLDEAVAAYRAALACKPDYVEAMNNLGVALGELGRSDEAAACYRQAIALRPDFVEAHNNLGTTFKEQGRLAEAIACHQQALRVDPTSADACNNLGAVLKDQGHNTEAADWYRKAIELRPDFPLAYNNLAAALAALGKAAEAETAYRQALTLQPDYAEAGNNLGALLRESGRLDEAVALHHRALALRPDFAAACNNLGVALMEQGDYDGALDAYRRALSINPAFAQAHNNLAAILKDLGQIDAALAEYRCALDLQPDSAEAYSNLLLTQQYSDASRAEKYAAHRRFAEIFEAPLQAAWTPHPNPRDAARRLKIGYVSADFRKHSVAYFIEPVFERHDRNQVEVHCYSNNLLRDAYTTRLATLADAWTDCQGLNDMQLAEKIRADGIDILVDLSGHTSKNRLLTFARKPAPLQISYLGYIDTTGLTSIDYRLTNEAADPPGSEAWYSETLYRFPQRLWWCYRPEPGLPEIPPLPALNAGFVTFGSLNYPVKISAQTVAAWARLLHAVPASRLVMAGLPPGAVQHTMLERFAAHGVAPQRLTLHPKLTTRQYRALNQIVDIALDPFPYNGGTTTCETLWLGLPVVALRGDSFVSRMGLALLADIGLPELAARDGDDYVDIAARLASDLDRLAALRAGMRARLTQSSLCDEAGFTRALETAYREMWRNWCEKTPHS